MDRIPDETRRDLAAQQSSRPLVEQDRNNARRAADLLVRSIEVVTETTDPTGPDRRRQLRQAFESLYAGIGETAVYVEEVPNRYGGDDPFYINRPWFRITSRIGHILIGWRKSVINIDWSDTVVKPVGVELFPNEDVTRGERWQDGGGRYIHAHGYENAARYLRVLHEVVAPLCVHCGRPEGEHRHPDRRCFTYVTGMRGEAATRFTPRES